MPKKLHWIDVLNEQTRWQTRTDLAGWFSDLIGRRAHLLDGSMEGFEEALGYMRRQVAALHFHDPVDLIWLDTQLKTVSLGLLHHQGAQPGQTNKLPMFRARVRGMHDSDLLRSLKDTLLVQFAEFVADSLAADASLSVCRCEGLYREGSAPDLQSHSPYQQGMELRWRAEIPLLREHTLGSLSDLHRCPAFFAATPKGRFCSDACRFSTFQIAKQVQEPGYLAARQKRYRKRQEQEPEAEQDS